MNKQELVEQIADIIALELGGYNTIQIGPPCEVTNSQFVHKSSVFKVAAAIVEAIDNSEETKAWKNAWERYPDKNELHNALRKIHVERTLDESKKLNRKVVLRQIEYNISDLSDEDGEGHIWWNKFYEFINEF